MNSLIYILGERKRVRIRIVNAQNQPFIISAATFSFSKGTQMIDSGNCDIFEDIVSVVLTVSDTGIYRLEISYEIDDELLKERVRIVVI